MSDQVGNPEDQFSQNEAHINHIQNELCYEKTLCGCTACFVLDLVKNLYDRFFLNAAHMVPYLKGSNSGGNHTGSQCNCRPQSCVEGLLVTIHMFDVGTFVIEISNFGDNCIQNDNFGNW